MELFSPPVQPLSLPVFGPFPALIHALEDEPCLAVFEPHRSSTGEPLEQGNRTFVLLPLHLAAFVKIF